MIAQVTAPTPPATTTTWIVIAVIIVLALAVVAIVAQRRRSVGLRDRFGPEYDRAVASTGSQQRAERELAAREQRHRKLDIRDLTPGARQRYTETWRTVQARFVDDPAGAVAQADSLLIDVMRDRGYPVDDPAHRMEDLSVEHAKVLDDYRTATSIAQRSSRGAASTEELRQAVVLYRSLFGDLLGANPLDTASVDGRIVEPRRADTTQGVGR